MLDYIKDEITVILTVWKRPHLEKQLNAVLKQTKKPYQVWIYQNESHFDIEVDEEYKKAFNISIIQSKDINFKFHGRFALPLLADTEYSVVFDDDTIPGHRWLENCLDTSKRNNCAVVTRGLVIENGFEDQQEQCIRAIGDGRPVEEEMEVDLGGHSWFFKTDWCKYMWRDRPFTWDNGEDIHFSAACQIYGGIKCFVPKMPANDKSLWGDLELQLGADLHATWRLSDHSVLRGSTVKYWYEKGWQPLITREKNRKR